MNILSRRTRHGGGVTRSAETVRRQVGFTLIEAIIVIAITGIVAAAVAMFIRLPVQGYVDSAARAELTDIADTALRRMARDLRLALPNSVRVNIGADGNPYIEMLLTKTGGRYLAAEDPVGGNILSFTDTTATGLNFDVVGTMPAAPNAIAPGDSIVVYNLGPGFAPADAYTGGNVASVNAVNVATRTVTMVSPNPFAAQPAAAKMTSPTTRFQVLDVNSRVTYVCDRITGNLLRYWGYPIVGAGQPTDMTVAPLSTMTPALLASRIVPWTGAAPPSCIFEYNNVANVRSGLIGLTITMQIPNSNSGTVVLSHQVHVDNTP